MCFSFNRTTPFLSTTPKTPLKSLSRTCLSMFSTFLSLRAELRLAEWYSRVNSIIWPTIHPNTTFPKLQTPLQRDEHKGGCTNTSAHLTHRPLSQTLGNIARPFRVVVFLSIYGNLYVLDNLRKLFTPFTVFSHSHYLLPLSLSRRTTTSHKICILPTPVPGCFLFPVLLSFPPEFEIVWVLNVTHTTPYFSQTEQILG